MNFKKIIACTLLSTLIFTGVTNFNIGTYKFSQHQVQAAAIDKYPRPIKRQQANYHWKNNCTWYVHK